MSTEYEIQRQKVLAVQLLRSENPDVHGTDCRHMECVLERSERKKLEAMPEHIEEQKWWSRGC